MMSNLAKMIDDTPPHIIGHIVDNHVISDIIGDDVHFYSPQLNFRIEPSEDNPEEYVIAGLVGPRPEVWTMFMFIYFSIGILGFFIGSYGLSKIMIGIFRSILKLSL